MTKIKIKLQKDIFHKSVKLPIAITVLALVVSIVAVPIVRADQFDAQINQLSQDNAQKQAAQAQLGTEAAGLTDTINKLQAQIDVLSNQIQTNKQKIADLQAQIDQAQAELDQQKKVLGEDIKQMYLEGQISTLEMLASSKDLSDFVDKQEYRSTVQDKIKTTLDKINDLKRQLRNEQENVQQALKDQQNMQDQLGAQQAQQNQLLSLNVAQQNQLDQQIKANSAQIVALRRQQAIENARYQIGSLTGDPNHGGYPSAWNNAPQDSIIDYWGMWNRECVSYTAFKVHQDYLAGKDSRDMPYWGGVGNANQWDDNARAAGIPVDTNPTVGSIAISNAGAFGHAMYVEAVYGDGTILVSQYNAALDGQFSYGHRYTTGLVFIHF